MRCYCYGYSCFGFPSAMLLSAMLFIAVGLGGGGCAKQNPVEQVSTSQSGIEVRDSAWKLAADDWNAWRGRSQNGISADESVAKEWSDASNIRWRTDVSGRGHSSPIVIGDSVFVSTADESKTTQSVVCLDRQSGLERWRTVIHQGGFPGRGAVHNKASHANGTIACDGRRLYTAMLNSGAITVTAIDLQGEISWQREVGKFVSKFGYAPSPVLYKSLVIVAADNKGGGYLAAVDGETGEVVWRVGRGTGDSYSSPMVARVGGRDQLLISGNDSVSSYDPATGNRLWQTECIAEATCGTIVVSGDRIFASGGYPESETVCLSADGEHVWSNNKKTYEPSMLVVGDNLLTVNDGGVAICWNAVTGEQLWKQRLDGNFSASPVLVGDTVFVPNLNGDTFVFRAGAKYEAVARNRLGNDCYASPAVSGGDIFLRIGVGKGADRREQVVCIGLDKPADLADESAGQ